MALITLDNGHDHTRPNTFGPAGLPSLREALDAVAARAGRGDIAAVGVAGKPFIFAAGADLTGAALIGSRDEALAIAQLGRAVFRRLGELGVPSFAFPECFLGLLPGWGGTYLLPHLIGPGNALKVIIENPLSQNRMLRGAQALSLGIADVMFSPADFLAESLRWAARVLSGSVSVPRVLPDEDWDQAVAAARFFADGKLHGAAPAPCRAIDLVAAARGRTRDEGFAAEDEGLADLLLSEELRSGLYAFDLTGWSGASPVLQGGVSPACAGLEAAVPPGAPPGKYRRYPLSCSIPVIWLVSSPPAGPYPDRSQDPLQAGEPDGPSLPAVPG